MQIKDFIFLSGSMSLIFLYFTFYPLNVDSTWILYVAEQIISGKTLYRDIHEVNPPLIFLYSMIAVYLSSLLSLSLSWAYILYVVLLISMSVYLVFSVIRFMPFKNIRYYLFMLIFSLIVLVSSDFGQREHLFMIFICPYIMMMMYRDKIQLSSRIITLIAIFASLGFNIKPHFFLIFIGIEMVYALHTRKVNSIFRIESLIITGSALVYILLIYVKFPYYIDFAVPLAMKTYVTLFNKPLMELLSNLDMIMLLFVLIVWALVRPVKIDLQSKVLFSIIITTLILYLLQQKGWGYHRLPFKISIFMMLSYIAIECIKENQIYLLGIMPFIIMSIMLSIKKVPKFIELENIVHKLPPESKIHIISTDIARGQSILVKNKQIWSSRFGALGILPFIVHTNNEELRKYLFNAMYEDIKRYQPDSIIFCGKYSEFNYYDYFTSKNDKLKLAYRSYYTKSEVDGYTVLSKIVKE